MNRLGRAVLNSPARAAAQRRYVIPAMRRLGGGLEGCEVLEIGCGCGAGTALLIDQLGADRVEAIDVDPVMVAMASRRLIGRASVRVGDMLDTGAAPDSFDAVVDMGAMHLEAAWRDALDEVARVLRPRGRFYFEEILQPGRQTLSALATGKRLHRDFTRRALLAELARSGLEMVGLEEGRPVATAGLVGDLIGVAVRRG